MRKAMLLLGSLVLLVALAFGFESSIAADPDHPEHGVGAQGVKPEGDEQAVTSARSGRWSDPAIWSGNAVPAASAKVVVREGTVVEYDLFSEEPIGSLGIYGSLRFSRQVHTSLDVGDISVYPGGLLEMGLPHDPIPADITARIRFVNQTDGEHALVVMGEAQIHGAPRSFVYSRLAAPAHKGEKAIRLEEPVDWRPGDHIVIATTTASPFQTEENDVESVRGTTVSLRSPLRFAHQGLAPTQAEVALLTRNVLITSKIPTLRGHTKYVYGAKGSISFAEFRNLGAEGVLGKYPIHFHRVGDSMAGSSVKGAAVWNSGNRFITIHSSQHITLTYNVGYNAIGHGFFLEDGDEMYNTLDRNLGFLTTRGTLIPSDTYAAIFWTQNPLNTYTHNRAVGGRRGFVFDIPNRAMDLPGIGKKVNLRSLSVLRFEENTAHSNPVGGLRAHGLATMGKGVSFLANFTGWRNGEGGVFLDAHNTVLNQPFLFGNGKFNLTIMGNNNRIEGGQLLGELPLALQQNPRETRPTPKGILLGGRGNVVRDTRLEGHDASNGLTPADIALVQDSENPIQALIENTVMKSRRTIVFGYPQNEQTSLQVRGFQGEPSNNFSLYRLDAQAARSCEATLDTGFVALRCPTT
jgi:hypothetical protein